MSPSKNMYNGAEIFFESLRRENVEYIFGMPGGATIQIYERLYDIDFLKHILVRHEQGATHMADGYARASGKTGVVLVTSGPGATNTVTGIATAYMDSSPIVVFTGQVPTNLIGNDAFQEADIIGITRPITKHSFLVRDVKDLASTIRKAFYIAQSGRPGPVVVDLPKDVISAVSSFEYPEKVEVRGYKPNYEGHINQIKKAARAIAAAKRPLLYVGGGVVMAGASQELRAFAIENHLPVAMTLQGIGAFPGTSELSLGMLGMHGMYWANQAINHCDVLVALGARFDDRVTGKVDTFATNAYKIHVDIDPSCIDKNVKVDVPIVGDVKRVLKTLRQVMPGRPNTDEWWQQIRQWQQECPLTYEKHDGKLRTQFILERLSEKTRGEAVVVSDVGQHQMFIAQYYKFNHPRSHLSSGGLGTMGFSVPAAIGAAYAVHDRPIISISGDGGFAMNMQELITAKANKLPIKFMVINNSFLGMVRQWQELFFEERYSFTDLSEHNPDYVKIAQAMGIKSFLVTRTDQVDATLEEALNYNDGPVFVEFRVIKEELVFPMVPAGASVSEMIVERLNPQRML
ncbi:biosynthetic-type acetolactate synthase large subunit [Caldithrix abyssi]|uniref:Acetolactate synthase n=1 Tax=Caldithrix abyssi DSM 13497 TaxID=880073 RepID=H1XQF6_CALAY|nr:biosynthetic-type acetolactate synthase large subunit [Caldithrix abyssi]APF19952.1 acetolactate synthase, large subunit [Caldithrix abyssi DSM 13497]EHO40043.1 acetolactate synthase, large subunit, biosynthetic type [Caldithrix abyssi DSM 13497]